MAAACTDMQGYLPTHLSKCSQKPTGDLDHDLRVAVGTLTFRFANRPLRTMLGALVGIDRHPEHAAAHVDDSDRLVVESDGGTLVYVRRSDLEGIDGRVAAVALRPLGMEVDPDGHAIDLGLESLDAPCPAAWSVRSSRAVALPAESHAVLEAPLVAPMLAAQRELAAAASPTEAAAVVTAIGTALDECRSIASARDRWQLEFLDSEAFGTISAWSVERSFEHDRFGQPTAAAQQRTTVFVAVAVDEVVATLTVMHTSSESAALVLPLLEGVAVDAAELVETWAERSDLLDGVSTQSIGPLERCGGFSRTGDERLWDDFVIARCMLRAG